MNVNEGFQIKVSDFINVSSENRYVVLRLFYVWNFDKKTFYGIGY